MQSSYLANEIPAHLLIIIDFVHIDLNSESVERSLSIKRKHLVHSVNLCEENFKEFKKSKFTGDQNQKIFSFIPRKIVEDSRLFKKYSEK